MPTLHDPEEAELKYLHNIAGRTRGPLLEIGCGDGRLTWHYASPTRPVVGLDPDPELLSAAVHHRPPALQTSATFTRAVAEVLPFPGETFALALMSWSF